MYPYHRCSFVTGHLACIILEASANIGIANDDKEQILPFTATIQNYFMCLQTVSLFLSVQNNEECKLLIYSN